MNTFMLRKEDVTRTWYEFDAEGQILGRLATQIAVKLIGKQKPEYTPHVNNGDCVIVVNAGKIITSGNKMTDKIYYNHSGFPGGIRKRRLEEVLAKKPEEVIRLAVKRMLPKNKLGRQMLKNLRVYAGNEHSHAAQQPVKIEL